MKILELLFPIILLGVYFLFFTKKKNNTVPTPGTFDAEADDYDSILQEEDNDTFIEGFEGISSKKEHYSPNNMEGAMYEVHLSKKEQVKKDFVQNIDNEETMEEWKILDVDEMKKAVIYSEILKKPYN